MNKITFYNWFLETNRQNDIKEQQKLVEIAPLVKDYFLGKISKLPSGSIFLAQKLEKNIRDGFRGQLVSKDIIGFLDEIMDPNNSSAKLLWCKSVRKQGVEKLQRQFLFEKYKIKVLAGKKHEITASGDNSYRFDLKTGELLKGVRKVQGSTSKSMDGRVVVKTPLKVWTFQKVTTDNGGGTDSVETELIETIHAAKKCVNELKTQDYFVFISDGPFYERKQYKSDKKTRYEKLYELSEERIIIATSNTLSHELEKRGLI
jgi:hypothetical protein